MSIRKKQKELSKSLNSLKCGNSRDESVFQKIIDIEYSLCKIEDEENYRRLDSSGFFHILNSEKASKAYSSWLKNSKKGDSISV